MAELKLSFVLGLLFALLLFALGRKVASEIKAVRALALVGLFICWLNSFVVDDFYVISNGISLLLLVVAFVGILRASRK